MIKAIRYLVITIIVLTLTLGSMAMLPAPQGDQQNSQKYFVVQFSGPIQESWKQAVNGEGAQVLDYIPDFAFKVRMNPGIANRIEQFDFVSQVTPFPSAFKFGPDLKRDGEVNVYRIRIERGSDFGLVRSLVARTGAEILGFENDLMVVAANGSLVDAIAGVDDVASISNYYLNEPFSKSNAPLMNDAARGVIGADVANGRGYDGSSQIAAVADTGLGGGTPSTAHPDIPASRIVAIYNWPGSSGGCFQSVTNDGSIDVDSGHGTHTASSVLSDGGPGGIGEGIAPAARLVFQSTENWARIKNYCQLFGGWPPNGYFLTGLPDDLRNMYQQAYNAGARIHSNSWGAAVAGEYTIDSVNTDSFVWTNRDMVVTFSAGNEGVDANADGVVDANSTGAPGTSKNVITVGASEGARSDNYPCDTSLTYNSPSSNDIYQDGQSCNSMGGDQSNFLGTAGERWGFTAEPLYSDVTAGNTQQMAPFSSRGPTDDGRIKPDVVAPGTWILSGYSSLYQEGYGSTVNPQNGAYQWDGWGKPYNSNYKYMGGTSMSNPLAAGGATVVKDYYQNAHGIDASAALVKATMINSAVDLLDENNDGVNDNAYPIPNIHEGWGLVNLDGATDGTLQYVDEGTGLATGGSQTFNVTPTGGPLKVTLVWSDYPSTETASANLVNDLDLTVAGGNTYRGNVFSGGWSQTGGSADRVNNVENVYIQSPGTGAYTVTVNAYNVPNGPQKFALVVDGGTIGTGGPTTGTLEGTVTDASNSNPISGATVTIVGGASTTTNASGFYQLTNVAQGTYDVTASATGYDPSTANGVVVTAGNTTTQDFALNAAAPTTGTLEGTVTDASTTLTISGATVTIVGGASTTTNSSGFYQFTNVAQGTYDVTASASGYNPSTANGVTVTAGSTTTQDFALTASPTGTIHVGALSGSSTVRRNNWSATVVVTVHDSGHNPVANITVTGDWSGASFNGGSNTCVTDGSGQCSVSTGNIKNDPSVTYTVTDLAGTGYTYDAGANDVTSITVNK
ncbi:MAG: S8 family serine peptidase [Anaerolineales bacterium]